MLGGEVDFKTSTKIPDCHAGKVLFLLVLGSRNENGIFQKVMSHKLSQNTDCYDF